MPRKKLDFTLEEVKEELAYIAVLLSEGAITSFGENFFLSVMNMPLKPFSENDSEKCINFSIKDINDSPITHDVTCAYDYAEGNRFGDLNIPDNFLDGMGEFYQFSESSINLVKDSKFKFLYDLTTARAALDNEDYLSLKELALLAGVDERTVRNAASSKEDNKLITKKSGGSTIIENDRAIRWLNSRPGFKPTQYIADTTLDTPRYFKDEVGFGKFITYCMDNKGLSAIELAQASGVEVQAIIDLENGVDGLYIGQVAKLAEVLGENTSEFMTDYMRIFHIKELADLLGYEYRGSQDNAKNFEKTKLAIFKQQLNLEAQVRLLNTEATK